MSQTGHEFLMLLIYPIFPIETSLGTNIVAMLTRFPLFTRTGRFVDRIELQEWDDGNCEQTALEDKEQDLLAIAYETCQIKVTLLPRPIVA